MPTIRNYGVGTGYTSSGITGAKSTFEYNEKVYACHVWDNLVGNETFIIIWDRKQPNGFWNTEIFHEWKNEGYKSAYEYAWIQNWKPGEWRARFHVTGGSEYSKLFTIKEKPAPAEIIAAQITSFTKDIPVEPVAEIINAQITKVVPSIPAEPVAEVINAEITKVVPSIPAEPIIIEPSEEDQVMDGIDDEIEQEEESYLKRIWQHLKDFISAIIKGDMINALHAFIAFGSEKVHEDMTIGYVPISPAGDMTISPEIAAKLGPKLTWVQKVGAFIKLWWKPIAKWAAAVMGTSTLVQFLYEETMQTQGIGIYVAISSKQWDVAWKALEEARKRLNHASFVVNWFGWTSPFAWNVFKQFMAATQEQYDTYEEVIIDKSGILEDPSINGRVFDKDEFRRRLLAGEIPDISDLITKAMEEAKPKLGTLKVTCNISGADVFIDGVKKGIVPYTKEMEAMSYHVLVSKFQYTEYEEDALIREGETTEIKAIINPITQPTAEKAKLQISVEPADAKVEVAGVPEITKSGNYEVEPGTYTIKASKEGYYEKSATAYAKANQLSVVSIILNEIPAEEEEEFGTLIITAIPSDINVQVAGIPEISSAGEWEIPPGTYTIKASKEGFYDKYATAYIKAGERFVVAFTLSEVQVEEIPTTEITVPLESKTTAPNAWKYSINAIDKATGGVLHARIFVDGVDIGHYTPWSIYLKPLSRYILRLEKYGYYPAEVEINTPELPV